MTTEKAAPIPAEERLWWFLFVLNACGDYGSYANDDPGEWVAAFCDDVEPTDTFNRACDLKLATCTHNSMDETSRVWITEAGKRFLTDRASQEENPRPAKTGGLETAVLRQPQEERIREKADDTRLPLDVEWEERIREDERLRFEGDLDRWMKTLGAGITGYQPEAYAVMDAACKELASSRGETLRLVLLLMSIRDYRHGFVDTNVRDVINAGLDDHPSGRARLRGDAS